MRALGSLDTTGEITFDRKAYDLVECESCELVYLSPTPSGNDLDRIYLASSQFTDDLYTDPQRVAAILEYMTSCLTRMLASAGKTHAWRIATLEIGAGLAWMARAAKSLNASSATTAQ
ncbi:MAG TPA: hypothetical protein VG840_08815, partial [Casimicrobiaceae bacterium]|nr:hypothetical protein [Casimicrobiaceae bacterium]